MTSSDDALLAEFRGLRADIAAVFRPRLRHSNDRTFIPHPEVLETDPDDAGLWTTRLNNDGFGPVDVLDVGYTVRFLDPERPGVEEASIRELDAVLATQESAFWLTHFSPGTCLRPGRLDLAAVSMSFARQLCAFSVQYTVASVLGEREVRTVHLVPLLDPPDPHRARLPAPRRRPAPSAGTAA